MAHTLQFVDSISASPTVRLDLNSSPWGLLVDGTSFELPPLDRAYVRTLMADGARIPAGAYDNRRLVLKLSLNASGADTTATHTQALMRELNRDTNILKWQADTTSPVFFRTFRTPPDRVNEYPGTNVYRTFEIELLAEPFAIGLPVRVGELNSNPRFDSGISDWTAVNNCTLAHNTSAALLHEGTGSLKVTPDGVTGSPGARTTTGYAATAGSWYAAEAWVLSATGYSDVAIAMDWYDSGDVLLSSTLGSTTAFTVGEWQLLSRIAVAPASTAYVRLRVRQGGTPAASDIFYIDQAYLSSGYGVSNDPAASANPCYFDVTGIVGDVETPAILTARAAETSSKGPTVLACRRRGTPTSAPFLFQAEGATMGTDTSVQGNDAVMSGSSNNYIRTTFATTTTMATRATFTIPSTSGVEARGTYRVFCRYRKSVAGDVITARWTANGDTYTTAAATTNRRWIDLGLMQLPSGPDPTWQGYSGVTLPIAETTFVLQAARTSGSGNLDIDCVLLVPADDWLCITDLAQAGDQVVIDGARQAVYPLTRGGLGAYSTTTGHAGGWPMLSPNQTNRIFFLLNGASTSVNDTITDTVGIDVRYFPRYLYVRPAST